MCLPLGKRKANLILTSTREDKLKRCRKRVFNSGHSVRYSFDLNDLNGIDELTDRAVDLFGTIDTVFLNAGISQRSKALDTAYHVDEMIMNVNFLAPVKIAKRLLPTMIIKGGHGSRYQ